MSNPGTGPILTPMADPEAVLLAFRLISLRSSGDHEAADYLTTRAEPLTRQRAEQFLAEVALQGIAADPGSIPRSRAYATLGQRIRQAEDICRIAAGPRWTPKSWEAP